jgi:hypothetical protein
MICSDYGVIFRIDYDELDIDNLEKAIDIAIRFIQATEEEFGIVKEDKIKSDKKEKVQHLRKQYIDLSKNDFDEVSIWEAALDEEDQPGQDETTMKPYIPDENDFNYSGGVFLIKAKITLKDKSTYDGFVMLDPGFGSSKRQIKAVELCFFNGKKKYDFGYYYSNQNDLEKIAKALNKKADDILPLKYTLNSEYIKEEATGCFDIRKEH